MTPRKVYDAPGVIPRTVPEYEPALFTVPVDTVVQVPLAFARWICATSPAALGFAVTVSVAVPRAVDPPVSVGDCRIRTVWVADDRPFARTWTRYPTSKYRRIENAPD